MKVSYVETVPLLDGSDLTAEERERFDYHDWEKIDAGTDSATFFRYRGGTYDLGNFLHTSATPGWDGAETDSFFSATVVRLDPEGDEITVGLATW